MNPRVKYVEPAQDYTIHLWFENGEQGIYDVKPLLDLGVFRSLRDPEVFNSVHPFLGTVQWNNEVDICPDTIYLDSVKIDPLNVLPTPTNSPTHNELTFPPPTQTDMPVISMFFGILISMYYDDNKKHKAPHIHAEYQGAKASFSIPDGEIIEGSMKTRQIRLIQAWIELHADELMANWSLATNQSAVFKIDPLK
jgi:hypothetical protein